MVELVVVREHLGVVDLGLELVEHGELAVDQRPVAAAIVTKMSDTPRRSTSTCSWATSTSVDCMVLNDWASSASSSLPRVLIGLTSGSAALPRVADRLDQRRQLFRGDLVGALRHRLDPAGHRAGEQPGDQGGEQHRAERDDRADERLLLRALGQGLGALDDRTGDVLLEVEALVGQRPEALEVELGVGAGLGGAAGGVELELVLRQRRREAALAELLGPLLGGGALNSFITDSISA